MIINRKQKLLNKPLPSELKYKDHNINLNMDYDKVYELMTRPQTKHLTFFSNAVINTKDIQKPTPLLAEQALSEIIDPNSHTNSQDLTIEAFNRAIHMNVFFQFFFHLLFYL